MLTQKACFNSPVWFNVGVHDQRGYGWYYDEATDATKPNSVSEPHPQCSACFIVSVQDSLESILDLAKTEGMLFKWGSGTGSNLSAIREENATLCGGGKASGPLSFMKGFDAFAGVIKSGGKTRRAAKMVILNVDHPDIEGFIWCKAKEEKKAHSLIDSGLRLVARRRSIFVDLLPEREQLGAGDGRVHACGGGRWRLLDQGASERPADEALQGARTDEADRRGNAPVRRSGHAVRYDDQPLAHLEIDGADQCFEPVLASTCSWTIRHATCRR